MFSSTVTLSLCPTTAWPTSWPKRLSITRDRPRLAQKDPNSSRTTKALCSLKSSGGAKRHRVYCLALGLSLDIQRERLLHLRELSSLLGKLADEGELTAVAGAVGRKTTFGIGEIRHIDNLLVGVWLPRLEQGIL